MDLGKCVLERFSDGEIHFYIDENVRGEDVFVIQTGAKDANFHLMELFHDDRCLEESIRGTNNGRYSLLQLCSTGLEGQAACSHFCPAGCGSLGASGADRVLTMDLHSPQIQGFFSVPVDNLMAQGVFAKYMRGLDLENLTIDIPGCRGSGPSQVVCQAA